MNETNLIKFHANANDTSIAPQPCDDYYQFVCAEWTKKHPIQDNRTMLSSRNQQIFADLKTIIENNNSSRMENSLYQICMNQCK